MVADGARESDSGGGWLVSIETDAHGGARAQSPNGRQPDNLGGASDVKGSGEGRGRAGAGRVSRSRRRQARRKARRAGEGYEAGGPLHGRGQRQAIRRAGAERRGGWDGLALADAVSRTITLVKSRTTTLFPFLLPQAPTCRALHAGSRTFPVVRHRVQVGVGGVREPRLPLVVVVV